MAKNPFDREPVRPVVDGRGRQLYYVDDRIFETGADYRTTQPTGAGVEAPTGTPTHGDTSGGDTR